jgi:hypothetical protein
MLRFFVLGLVNASFDVVVTGAAATSAVYTDINYLAARSFSLTLGKYYGNVYTGPRTITLTPTVALANGMLRFCAPPYQTV